MVALINGGVVDENSLIFSEKSYNVFDAFTGENLTNEIRQSDKVRLFPGFDRARDNERSFVENYVKKNGKLPLPTGSTSIAVNFWQQITTDPLQAPIAVALGQGASGEGLGAGTTSKAIKTVVIIAGIALGLYALSTFTKFTQAIKP